MINQEILSNIQNLKKEIYNTKLFSEYFNLKNELKNSKTLQNEDKNIIFANYNSLNNEENRCCRDRNMYIICYGKHRIYNCDAWATPSR